MKKILFIFMMVSGFASANPLGGNPTDGYCQTVDGSACGWGGSRSSRQIYKVPNRWGAIYFNAANWAIGYSENNTEGFKSANKEALESCIKAGGGKNPISKSGKGCHMMQEYRNGCGALALGGVMGNGSVSGKSAPSLEEAEKLAVTTCEEGRTYKCTIRYSGCSFHPDYHR